MTRSRFVVAALLFLLFVQTAAGDCLTPAWESHLEQFAPASAFRTVMVVDDFDGDGIDDVVFIRTTNFADTVFLQRGRGNGFFAAPADLYTAAPAGISTERRIHHAVAKDLNGDGKLDLLFHENLERLVFLPGNGDGTFANPLFSSVDIGSLFAVADLTGDDIDDVAAYYYTASSAGVVLFAGTGTGTFNETARIPLSASPFAIAAGDLDGDGANDLVVGYGADDTRTVDLLFGNDDGTFDPAVPRPSGDSRAITIELADLENDGDLDIVAVNFFDQVAVLRNHGGRTFDPATTYRVSQPYTSVHNMIHVAVADVTGDGERDLLVTTSNHSLATLRGRGDGTFNAPQFELFPEASSGSTATFVPLGTTDFDGDGRVDVIIGQNFLDGLRVVRNRCGDVNVVLTANASTITAGQNVTVQVSARGHDEGAEEPPPVNATGTVSIFEGTTALATGQLLNGEVSLTVPGLAPGVHKLVARYGGDAQYEPTQSARIIVRVTQEPGTTPPPRRRAVGR